jgi:perosamine synthetase
MQIPLSNPDITELEIKYVTEVLRTPHLSLGPKLAEFEQKMAHFVGRKYAIVVNSGTAGLHLVTLSPSQKGG